MKPSEIVTMAKSMKLGWGGRFEKLTKDLQSQWKYIQSAKAIAASIWRKKYGNAKFTALARKGKMK